MKLAKSPYFKGVFDKVVRLVGVEPTTYRVETGHSIQLNYRRANNKAEIISQPYLKIKLKENLIKNN